MADSRRNQDADRRPIVQWFGAHPVENIASMEVYRESLLSERRDDDDDFVIRSWPAAGSWQATADKRSTAGLWARCDRAMRKYLGYAMRFRRCPGDTALVHLLDHSIAHLMPHLPKNVKTVVTVHDLIPLSFPGGLSAAQQKRFRRSVDHLVGADAVIAVSEFTKSEAVTRLGLSADRVHVVPDGVNYPVAEQPLVALDAVKKLRAAGADAVVLSVGNTALRKNLQLLPDALQAAAGSSGKKFALLRIGDPLDPALAEKITAVVGADGLLELGRVDELTLWQAYRSADLLLFPSLHEGFGLPVLEALACGTAVACSNTTSLPEVGGAVSEYFDPADADAAATAILRCIETESPDRRAARIGHAGSFSWRSHLLACHKIYEQLLA